MNASIAVSSEASLHISDSDCAARLVDSTWCCALVLPKLDPVRRAQFLDTLLDQALATELTLRRWALAELAHFLEDMSVTGRKRFLAAQSAELCDDNCGCSALDATEKKSRLERRLSATQQLAGARMSAGDEQASARPARMAAPAATRPGAQEQLSVALVVPEFLSANTFLQPPLEMMLAAARLRNAGYRVRLIDNRVERLSFDALENKIASTDIILVTTTPYDHIQNYFLDYRLRHAFQTISFLKLRFPHAVVIACGAHGTVRPDIVFKDSLADMVLKGEFDTELVPVADCIRSEGDLSLLPSVCLRGADNLLTDGQGGVLPYQLVQLGDRFKLNSTQDDWASPAYDLIDLDDYYGDVYVDNRLRPQKRCATTLATRGCAHDCSFCFNFWGRRVRYRSPESVVEEMCRLEADWHANHLFFLDFHFTQNPAWVSRFCQLVRESGVHLTWSAQVRCDAIPLPLLEEMAVAHCAHLWLGVESFDPEILAGSRKYTDAGPALLAIANCRRTGIQPHLFVMIGLPGETRKSMNTTMRQMHAAKASYCGVMVATPRFGTPYYELAKIQFPQLGDDFYSLRAVRGLIANELKPSDLHEALSVFEQRDFIYRDTAPQMAF